MSALYDFNSTFFLSLGTLIISALGICCAYGLKSKCSNIKCLCFELTRNIEAELTEDQFLIEAGLNPQISTGTSTLNNTITHRPSILNTSKSPSITPSPSHLALNELNNENKN